ncbi:hypothetical protein AC249_AIPGENE17640 [Exaiptasia diaphana]|nr:hypothetical protein AC249_AIPGENE17640 [Exaiptasia diaphana]
MEVGRQFQRRDCRIQNLSNNIQMNRYIGLTFVVIIMAGILFDCSADSVMWRRRRRRRAVVTPSGWVSLISMQFESYDSSLSYIAGFQAEWGLGKIP